MPFLLHNMYRGTIFMCTGTLTSRSDLFHFSVYQLSWKYRHLVVIKRLKCPWGNIQKGSVLVLIKWILTLVLLYFSHVDMLITRGRFGQVHKCVEIASGLRLAAKIIKVKAPKDRVSKGTRDVTNKTRLVGMHNLVCVCAHAFSMSGRRGVAVLIVHCLFSSRIPYILPELGLHCCL